MTKKHGFIYVTVIEELEKAERFKPMYVLAVCPMCYREWSSIPANARNIITHGCLLCTDTWKPICGIIVPGGVNHII